MASSREPTWSSLLKEVQLPQVYRVRQSSPCPAPVDVAEAVENGIRELQSARRVTPGMRVAIAVGSRGVANIGAVVKSIVRGIEDLGAIPFVVPAMGSHGGATASGQAAILAAMGVSQASLGVPVMSSLDVVKLGESPSGFPVYIDAAAAQADGIVVVNRVKPHTAFRGSVESGLCKMMAIGLGNRTAASKYHSLGIEVFPVLIPEVAAVVSAKANLLFGVALLENRRHETVRVVFVSPENLVEVESELLLDARGMMARIPVTQLDILVVRQIGKDISGEGMDPNVTGRYVTKVPASGISVQKIVVLDLTAKSGSNATGVGIADVTTRRVVDKIDYDHMYVNAVTACDLAHVKIPLTMDSDLNAIRVALTSLYGIRDRAGVKLAVIRNTLELDEMLISAPVLQVADPGAQLEIVEGPFPLQFSSDGGLETP